MPELSYFVGPCCYGAVSMLASSQGILAIDLGDCEDELKAMGRILNQQFLASEPKEQATWWEQLRAHIDDPSTALRAPLLLKGTEFQLTVYAEIQAIETGDTVSYTELAMTLNVVKGVRAVAGACAQNRLALAVPCHRVLGRQGRLTGYRWGKSRKAEILRREAYLAGTSSPSLFCE